MADIIKSQGRVYIAPNPVNPQIVELLKDAIDREFQTAELTIYSTEANPEVAIKEISNLAQYDSYISIERIRKNFQSLLRRCWRVEDEDICGHYEVEKLVDNSIKIGLKAQKLFQLFCDTSCGEKRIYVM